MKVLNLIAARLLAAVSDPHRYAETIVKLTCAGREFSVKGKEIIADGWKAVDQFFNPKEKKNDDRRNLRILFAMDQSIIVVSPLLDFSIAFVSSPVTAFFFS